ncbi:MAG: DM13 domain-containing protein [Leptolyngbya sp. SIO3F4]|nr:DM13 domain-containing protein [Leptolyngbya sp. SIO3F4]
MTRTKSLLVAAATAAICTFPSVAQASDFLNGSTVIQSSSFTGESGHVVSGGIDIVQKGDIYHVVLGEDFSFDGAPDPKLGFSNDDAFVSASLFSGLNLDSGQQIYRLPATLDVSHYDELTIWCDQFSVPLAEAKF